MAIHTDVTCQECLRRQASVGGRTFRERHFVGSPSRVTGSSMARGHAMYKWQGFIISLCVAGVRVAS